MRALRLLRLSVYGLLNLSVENWHRYTYVFIYTTVHSFQHTFHLPAKVIPYNLCIVLTQIVFDKIKISWKSFVHLPNKTVRNEVIRNERARFEWPYQLNDTFNIRDFIVCDVCMSYASGELFPSWYLHFVHGLKPHQWPVKGRNMIEKKK